MDVGRAMRPLDSWMQPGATCGTCTSSPSGLYSPAASCTRHSYHHGTPRLASAVAKTAQPRCRALPCSDEAGASVHRVDGLSGSLVCGGAYLNRWHLHNSSCRSCNRLDAPLGASLNRRCSWRAWRHGLRKLVGRQAVCHCCSRDMGAADVASIPGLILPAAHSACV